MKKWLCIYAYEGVLFYYKYNNNCQKRGPQRYIRIQDNFFLLSLKKYQNNINKKT